MVPPRVIACCFALAAFCVALLAGLAAGADVNRTMSVALGAMFVCYMLGLLIGAVAARAVREAIEGPSSEGASPSPASGAPSGARPAS